MEIIGLNVKNSDDEKYILVYEFYKSDFFKYKGDVLKLIEKGLYNVWNYERIKSAFSFYNGNLEDFIEFVKNNRVFCAFFFVNENFIIC